MNNKYKVMYTDSNKLHKAVFEAVYYPSGELSFWQQVSKSYYYKAYAYKEMKKMIILDDIFNNDPQGLLK